MGLQMDKIYYHYGEYRNLKGVKVYKELKKKIIGMNFIIKIIGSSHYISTIDGNYSDIFSCINSFSSSKYFPLDNAGFNKTLNFENNFLKVKSVINIIEIDKSTDLGSRENFNLYYNFSKDAFTGIKVGDNYYETTHTYPEFNIIVITKCVFEKK